MLFSESTFSLDVKFKKVAEDRKMEEKVFRNCLKKEKISWYFPGSLPGHSTIDSKVERVGETDESIDCKDYVLGNVVVKQEETKTKIIKRSSSEIQGLMIVWHLLERVWSMVMTIRGISVLRKNAMTTISIRVIFWKSLWRRLSRIRRRLKNNRL